MGGNNWLYEELFWFMGHPEVYVILLPGVGAVCEIVPVFARKPLFGYKMVVAGEIGDLRHSAWRCGCTTSTGRAPTCARHCR